MLVPSGQPEIDEDFRCATDCREKVLRDQAEAGHAQRLVAKVTSVSDQHNHAVS